MNGVGATWKVVDLDAGHRTDAQQKSAFSQLSPGIHHHYA